MFIFFFSSRRRHTRWPRDWSSDVCSSDLQMGSVKKESPVKPKKQRMVCGQPLLVKAGNIPYSLTDFGRTPGIERSVRPRSEERRVGKEWRARRGTDQYKKNKETRRRTRVR